MIRSFINLVVAFGLFLYSYVAMCDQWLVADIEGIDVSSETVLQDSIKVVKREGYSGLILKINSPGGSVEVTRNMIGQILAVDFPIISFIPDGGRAASAGSFIAVSSHVIVMGSGTNIGASIPISSTGKDLSEDLKTKAQNDLIAFMDSVCDLRAKNKDMIRSFIKIGTSITEKEALDHNVIDLISSSYGDFFQKLKGKRIKVKEGVEFEFTDDLPEIKEYKPTVMQRIVKVIANPNICYLLFIAGIIGLGFELTHPGIVFPGVFGAVSLILSFIAMSVLPINYGGLILILLGIIFLVAEAFLPSFGVVGIGGIISFVLGSFFLIDPSNEQGMRLAWSTIIPTSICAAGICIFISYLVISNLRRKRKSVNDGFIDQEVKVIRVDQSGIQVSINGEIWNAKVLDDKSVDVGELVKVKSVSGLELVVEKK